MDYVQTGSVAQAAFWGFFPRREKLVGKPIRKRPHGRPRCKWEDNIRMDLREIWWKDVVWMHLN
jgi:hypothetical protein